ncbi:MAG: DUF3696 domain-containing protein [Acidobacteriota bacterium]
MLKQLRIKNFKGWKDTGPIRLAPITLFFGANSSGKSSIGQFLMMLKQTVEYPDRKAVFYPGGRNSAVQLGSYQEMVFRRDRNNRIAFDYQWSLPETMRVKDPLTGQVFAGQDLDFSAEVELNEATHHLLQVSRFKYRLLDEDTLSFSIELSRDPAKLDQPGYSTAAESYHLVRKQRHAWAIKNVVRFYGFPDEVVAYYKNADFVQDLNLAQEKLFNSISYLGPLRTKAERLYTWGGVTPESVGFAGENTVAAILAARDRKISLGYKRPAKPIEEIIALKLREMGLIEDFKVNPISEQRQEYEVRICINKGSKDGVDLPDVGFGISQVLPVLVQCFYAPAGSIIIIEQPEIHLHPSAQAALADVMIDVINSREDGKDRGIQLIIETHSEHFLRRLQRRIAEDAIPEEKVSAYFANINKSPATLESLQIDMFGNIKNWPENFFGDEMGDITGHARAALQKRILKTREAEES